MDFVMEQFHDCCDNEWQSQNFVCGLNYEKDV